MIGPNIANCVDSVALWLNGDPFTHKLRKSDVEGRDVMDWRAAQRLHSGAAQFIYSIASGR